MKKYHSNINYRIVLAIAFLVIPIVGFSFLPQSAEMKQDSETGGQVTSPLKRLAFSYRVSFRVSDVNIHTINADGTNEDILTQRPDGFNAGFTEPAWSPDGNRIVYVDYLRIFVMDANGDNKTQLTVYGSDKSPTWSVTGKIAFERGSIWTMNADGTEQTLFPGISQPTPKTPKWSPDGSKLAFTSGGEIWVINSDGTNERRVTNNSTIDADPDWSPDGTRLVYQKGERIAVINLDGTNETNLTDGFIDEAPAWSNDGISIAFSRKGERVKYGLYVMDVNGANQVRIVIDQYIRLETSSDDPAWRPIPIQPNTYTISGRIEEPSKSASGITVNLTGSATAQTTTDRLGNYQFSNVPVGGNYTVRPSSAGHKFTPPNQTYSNLNANEIADFAAVPLCAEETCKINGKIVFSDNSIYTMNHDGTNITKIRDTGGQPRYSWDGSEITFVDKNDSNDEIYKMNADGSSVTRLTNNSARDEHPTFSPDGQSIAFDSNRDGGNSQIFIMNNDGSNPTRLTSDLVSSRYPSYSPDGNKIVFAGNRGLYTIDSDGTNLTLLYEITEGSFIFPSYSPDGSEIILTYAQNPLLSQFFIYTINSDGTDFSYFAFGWGKSAFSPDGTKVVYRKPIFILAYYHQLFITSVNGTTEEAITGPGTYDSPDWQPIFIENNVSPSPAPFDFDGDGRSDVSVFRPSENRWYILQSSNLQVTQEVFAVGDDIPTPADFDGDGITDIAIFRPSDGNWWYLASSDNTQRATQFGAAGDIPMPSDIDGDGIDDFVFYRPTENRWYRFASESGEASDIPFGANGDKPLIGDFDGDGSADAAIFRPSDGNWWFQSSLDNSQRATLWGISTDIPCPADFDGDGITDFAIYRPSEGGWYISNSSTGQATTMAFGVATDIPIPADYDGDGKADIAVFRPSTGIWYILQSTNGFSGLQFGVQTDKPIPSVYVQ